MKAALMTLTAALLVFHACSHRKDMGKNQTPIGHERLYAYPEKPQEYLDKISGDKRYKEIVFAVMNDTEGGVLPNEKTIVDPATEQKYVMNIGGVSGYKAYLNILRRKFPNKVQAVHSGSFLSAKTNPAKTLFYLNYLNLDAAGLSKSDFGLPYRDNYVQTLDNELAEADFKVLSSNLFNLEEAGEFELDHILKSATARANDLQIGYISMVSPAMAKKFDTEKLNKVYFQPMAAQIILLSNELRKKGADVVALMLSHGVDCTSQQAQTQGISQYKVNFAPGNEKICDLYDNELAKALAKLPPNMVDIVFTNGIDSKAANFISGYPVLQSYPGGEHLSWARLVYDSKFKRVDKKQTQIMQPVQLCHRFFKETEDCYAQEVLRNIELVPAMFLGEKVDIQPLPTRK